MNIEETKEAIEVMQAYVDGKDIEMDYNGTWLHNKSPLWRWGVFEYRIAEPKPVEIEVGMELVLSNSPSLAITVVLALYRGMCFYSRGGQANMETYKYLIDRYSTQVNGILHPIKAPEAN